MRREPGTEATLHPPSNIPYWQDRRLDGSYSNPTCFQERLVCGQLHKHRLLTSSQSGFCPGHSTQDPILKEVDDWRVSIDIVGTLFIDLSKAFDSTHHQLLLSKLDGAELVWFQSYFFIL